MCIRDRVQQVFVVLLAEEARVLRQWDPARGASFEGYVGLVAEREVISTLRSRRRSPWQDEATDEEELSRLPSAAPDRELTLVQRGLLVRVIARAEARLS